LVHKEVNGERCDSNLCTAMLHVRLRTQAPENQMTALISSLGNKPKYAVVLFPERYWAVRDGDLVFLFRLRTFNDFR
jgi:hypothetical protein